MITFAPTAISKAEDADLRAWLGKSGAHIMEKIATSKMDQAVIDAMLPALESKDYIPKLDAANASLIAAQRYRTFLDVWREFTQQPTDVDFQIFKLTQ